MSAVLMLQEAKSRSALQADGETSRRRLCDPTTMVCSSYLHRSKRYESCRASGGALGMDVALGHPTGPA